MGLLFASLGMLGGLYLLLLVAYLLVAAAVDLPFEVALLFPAAWIVLQYVVSPWVIQAFFKIDWHRSLPEETDRRLAKACLKAGIRRPRIGIITDGNPNAFTFGHGPWNARVVVTTGLLEMLDEDEVEAVLAHELGHVKHWDFVLMTVAAVVPMALYFLYRYANQFSRRGSSKSKDLAATVGLVSYLIYLVSEYVVLWLSRIREYYADHFSANLTGQPNALALGLVKVGYGLARVNHQDERAETMSNTRAEAVRCLGIANPLEARSLALVAATPAGTLELGHITQATKFDLWNPWASLYELASTHPLTAKRIRAMNRVAAKLGQPAAVTLPGKAPESFWGEFLVDLLFWAAPALVLLAGLVLAASGLLGAGILGWLLFYGGLGWFIKYLRMYAGRPEPHTVVDLLGEVKVSPVRPVAARLKGQIIGRGVPGLIWSEHLVLRDDSGFITLQYRQPLSLWNFFFGLLKAHKYVGQEVEAVGWFRRGNGPWFELKELLLPGGRKLRCWAYVWRFAASLLALVAGTWLILAR